MSRSAISADRVYRRFRLESCAHFAKRDRSGATMSEFTIKDKVAIVGLGETQVLQARRGAGQRIPARARSDSARGRRRRHAGDRDRRHRVVQQRPQRFGPRRDRARPAGVALHQHVLGRRRRWRLGRNRQRRGRDRRRLREVRRRVSSARAGPVRPLRSDAGDAHDFRPYRVHLAVRDVDARAMDRAAHAPLHARSPHHAGPARGDRDGLLSPRAVQSARDHVRPSADARRPTTSRDGSSSRFISTTAASRTTAPPR